MTRQEIEPQSPNVLTNYRAYNKVHYFCIVLCDQSYYNGNGNTNTINGSYSPYDFCTLVGKETNGYVSCGERSVRRIPTSDSYVGLCFFSESDKCDTQNKALICSLVSREASSS